MVTMLMRSRWAAASLASRWRGERGATAVEYALMLALIAIVIVAAVTVLGQETSEPFEDISVPLGG